MLVAQITDTHITSSGKLALRRLPPKGGVVGTVSGLNELSPRSFACGLFLTSRS